MLGKWLLIVSFSPLFEADVFAPRFIELVLVFENKNIHLMFSYSIIESPFQEREVLAILKLFASSDLKFPCHPDGPLRLWWMLP